MRVRLARYSLFLAVVIAAACGGQGGTPPPAGPAPGGAPAAESASTTLGSACDCPRLPVVATSESPDPGRVQYELSEADLEKLFSNRDLIYRGQWALAFPALDAEIDPTGTYQINQGARSEPTYPVDLVEGQLTGDLFSPPPLIGAQAAPQPMMSLLYTIARTNKYGEPEVSLRADTIRAARFLVGDLATIPAGVMRQDPRAKYIGSVSYVARVTLNAMIYAASPEAIGVRPQDAAVEQNQSYDAAAHVTTLELTRFDLADAALDVLRSVDAKGTETGLFDPRTEYEIPVIDTLLDVAAGRSTFGGPATPGSPLDAVACKAFVTLVRLTDKDFPGTWPLRQKLLDAVDDLGGVSGDYAEPLRHARFEAAQAALALTGPADADEARGDVDAMIPWAVGYAGTDANGTLTTPQQLGDHIDAIKFFEANADAPLGENRDAVAAEVQRDLQNIKVRVTGGTASSDERTFLGAWSTDEVDTTLASIAGTPVCTSGNCATEYAKEKPTITHEQWLTRPLILVRLPRGFPSETLDSVTVDQPVEVTLRSPSGGAAAVTVTNESTGASHAVALGAMQPLDLRAANGDIVRLDAQGATPVEVTVYRDVYLQTIGRAQISLNALYDVYLTELQDGGAVDDPPDVAAARLQAVRKKLHAIANARLIMAYEQRPGDRFDMWPATRAAIGMKYVAFVQTDPAGWDNGYNSQNTRTFKGPDPRFPGVSYDSFDESALVNYAIDATKSNMSKVILRQLGQMSVGLYRSYITASCFELQRISIPLCPEDFWIMVVGTDATGTELSANDRWLHGITIAVPLVLQSGQALATLETYTGRQFVPPKSDVPISAAAGGGAAEEHLAVGTSRRSETISTDERNVPSGSATVEDQNFTWLDQEKSVPEAVMYVPPSFNRFAKPGKALSPGSNLIQIADNTCALTVYERIRRFFGLPARTEAVNVRLAYSRSRYLRGDKVAYTPDEGAYREGLVLMYEGDGGRVLNIQGKKINLRDVEQELLRGRAVSGVFDLGINPTTGKKVYHAVQIEEVLHYADGRTEILFWDPWNGNEWTLDICHFLNRWVPEDTIIVDMADAMKRLR
jgi:hypothetical protein